MAKNGDPKKRLESESDVDGEGDKDEASSEEDVSSDPEDEPTETQTSRKEKESSTQEALKKSQTHPSSKPQQQSFSSSSEEGSGSESDTESDGSDSNIKPLASKHLDDSRKSDNGARKPRSNPNHLEPACPVKSVGAKRLAEEKVEDKDVKKSKKRPLTEPEKNKKSGTIKGDAKKQIFQRLWSEDDEIVILKGMIDYEDLNNAQPVVDLNAFHDFIKKNLHVDVTRGQLQDKIRRLKKKYVNNRNKEIQGQVMTFTRPHEQTAYEWSKKVWMKKDGKRNLTERGCESPNLKGSAVRKSSSKRAKMVEIGEAKEVRRVEVLSAAERPCPNGVSIEEGILREGVELLEREKGVECEREWKKLKLKEMELYMKKLDLLIAQTKLILDATKSTNH